MQSNLFNLCAECSDEHNYDSSELAPCHESFEATHQYHRAVEQEKRDVRVLIACYEDALRVRCLEGHKIHDVIEP